ncbi:MAG TPA: hypothetical protein VJ577_20105 [Burkholderiaceae bacterium]|nr:hypothetical protein [Burkholderiaceae bacterium]
MAKIEILEWSEVKPGGYRINDVEFRGEAAEALVQEAKEIALATRRDALEVLAQIIPEDHMASAPDKLAHDVLAAIFGSQFPAGASSFTAWEGINGFKATFQIDATGKFIDIAMTPEQVEAVRATGLLGTYGVQIERHG